MHPGPSAPGRQGEGGDVAQGPRTHTGTHTALLCLSRLPTVLSSTFAFYSKCPPQCRAAPFSGQPAAVEDLLPWRPSSPPAPPPGAQVAGRAPQPAAPPQAHPAGRSGTILSPSGSHWDTNRSFKHQNIWSVTLSHLAGRAVLIRPRQQADGRRSQFHRL